MILYACDICNKNYKIAIYKVCIKRQTIGSSEEKFFYYSDICPDCWENMQSGFIGLLELTRRER